MIYRCTARFMQSFDALEPRMQALALKALADFRDTPRSPTRDVRVVSHPDPSKTPFDVWDVPFGGDYHLTYAIIEGEDPDHFVCVFRHVGKAV
jgi:hypothetical protein